ncbi:protein Daple isoform X3 [Betta splendens]|uniref:Protein Daple isoform X3 n=1 Tax=Betta splendens TaxID=158456 RepID=A0A6P7LJ79_BETSP|nr:protein Daple isoform X3 [Betta splendens]
MKSLICATVRTLGPLSSCGGMGSEDHVSMFMELVDGVFLHKIMTHIDPSPTNQSLYTNVNNDVSLRLHNLTVLIRHIRTYYQEILKQLIVMPLPNILCIAKDPISARSMEELKRLLLLILGCAVQSDRKEEMIEKIKLLDIETQAAIVSYIQEVTHNQMNVLDLNWLEEDAELPREVLEPLSRNMALLLQQLIDQRDKATQVIVDLTQERDYLSSQQPQENCRNLSMSSQEYWQTSEDSGMNNGGSALNVLGLSKEEKQHLSVELADTKAKLLRYRQELEDKTEQLMDSKHEVERLDQELQRLKQENQALSCEARSVRVYRDEVDSLRERAARVDRLETELTRCKEKLNDVHFYKTRVEELREDNLTLLETKVLLEEQLAASRTRCNKLHILEKDNLLLQAKIQDLEMERDSERQRLEELVEENMLLEIGQKQSMNESAHLGWELEQLSKNTDHNESHKSLVHELNECVSSRVLKLEKQNQDLQAFIERLKEENFLLQEKQIHIQDLDKENESLTKKVARLQGLLDQERLTNLDMESLGEKLMKDKQSLEREMHILRTEKEQQISELEREKHHLSDAVGSLQERAQSNNEARVCDVEAENCLLHQNITDTSSRLASLETQHKQANEEMAKLREKAGRCEELEREMARLERTRDTLNKEVASLRMYIERSEALDKEVSSLNQEVYKLKREAEVAQHELQRLGRHEVENNLLTKENLDLRCALENLRSVSICLANLQEEHKGAQLQTQKLQKRLEEVLEEAHTERKRVERLELNVASVNQEKHRLEKQIESGKEKKEEMEREMREINRKEEELRREVVELKGEQRKREEGEKERRKLQMDLDQSEKGRKHMEKESWKIRRLLEEKETELEEKTKQLSIVLKEGIALNKEVDRLKEVTVKAKEVGRENKELQRQLTIDRKTLAALREELVIEKLSVQQQSVELENLNKELEKVGLNREKLLQEEHTLEDSKYRQLESRLEETVHQTTKINQEKISTLQNKLEESNKLNNMLRTELATAHQTLNVLHQEKEQNYDSQLLDGQQSQATATVELLRLKDYLIGVEKSNASLQTESSLLKEQLRQLENQNTSVNNQIVVLQRTTSTLQEQNSALHTQAAKLQVENSTLSCQNASLMAQNAVLQGQVTALETEIESWQRQREEAWQGRENVLSDHERLLSVHERQAHEYEQLMSQHAGLKSKHRALESENRAMHSKYCVLLHQKEKWEEQEGQSQKEKEDLHEEVQKNRLLQQENLQLKSELDRLTGRLSQQTEQCEELKLRINELKSSLGSAQLELSRSMVRHDLLMEQHQSLDLTMTKLDNHCELLSRLKGNLEEENHHLLSQINLLSQQNHILLERSMESKELYHQEQKLYIDKLNSLRRQKEKLEEKIMDQYKFYDPTPKKRGQWSGAKALAKLMKPRKETSRERGGVKEGSKERERAKSAPDIPLPAPPSFIPSDIQASHTQGTGYSQDCRHMHSNPDNHITSPIIKSQSSAVTPISRDVTDRNLEFYRSSTPGSSVPDQAFKAVNSTSSCRLGKGSSHRLRVSQQNTSDSTFGQPCIPVLECSYNTSSSNSPVNYKDHQGHPASLSTNDVMGLSQSEQSQPCSSTLLYDHTPQRAQPQCGASVMTKTRPSSPGSEMVTLEEFLQESNLQSPPVGSTGSREDIMTDYFTKCPTPSAPLHITPTSYVTPTVLSFNQRPGQSVKPSLRQPVSQLPTSGQLVTKRTSQSLNRAFSLASADLLRSNGPNCFRANDGSSAVSDVIQLKGAERPRSAHLCGSISHEDDSFLTAPIHHSSSLSLRTERYSEQERENGRAVASQNVPSASSFYHHHGEVALVTPVRAVATTWADEVPQHGEVSKVEQLSDSAHSKRESMQARCGSIECPKSTPASPDSNNDPQTVWYEYGCV